MDEKALNPFEGLELENIFGAEETENCHHYESSGYFLDPNGYNDAFAPHPLAWDSITYRSVD